jgi:hypothetical protein
VSVGYKVNTRGVLIGLWQGFVEWYIASRNPLNISLLGVRNKHGPGLGAVPPVVPSLLRLHTI